jgi:hypothetical protein
MLAAITAITLGAVDMFRDHDTAPDPADCTDATEHQDVERLDLDDTGPPRYRCHRCGTEWTDPDEN